MFELLGIVCTYTSGGVEDVDERGNIWCLDLVAHNAGFMFALIFHM